MSRTVQIRDLPDDVHRVLRLRAAAADLSLNEYLRREVTEIARRPTVAEFLAAARSRARAATTTEEIVAAVRGDRDAHDR